MADDLKSYKSSAYDTIDKIAAAKAGIPVSLLSGIRLKGEKSNADQVSNVGAATVYQIIPSTRDALLKRYGVDAYKNPQSAALAAAYHLKESLDRNKGDQVQAVGEYIGGTDRKNWGKTTKAYIQRVTGQAADSGSDTFDQQFNAALADIAPSKPKQSGLQQAMKDYQAGKMGKDDAAAFANLIKSGQVIAPESFKLKAEHEVKTLPADAVAAYNNGDMSETDMAAFEKLASDTNRYQLPQGTQLQRPKTMAEKIGIGKNTTIMEDLGFGKNGLYAPLVNNPIYGGLEAGASTLAGGLAGAVGVVGGFARGLGEDIASGNIGTPKAQAMDMAAYTAQKFAEPFAPVTEKGQKYVGNVSDFLGNSDTQQVMEAFGPIGGAIKGLGVLAKGAVPQVATRAAPVMQKAGQVAQGIESGIAKAAAPVGEAVQQAGQRVAGGVKGAVAGAVERVTPSAVSGAQDIIQTAEQYGVPVMTSDVVPPKTFVGKSIQAAGERIPIAGTGGKRVAQAEARKSAIGRIAEEYGVTGSDDLSTQIVSDLQGKHSATIQKYSGLKNEVFDALDEKGSLDVTRTTDYLNGEIDRLKGLGQAFPQKDIKLLEDFRDSIQGKSIKQVEELRKVLGDQLASTETTAKSALEKIANNAYGNLKQDMGDFIKANGERKDFTKWTVANKRLSDLINETKTGKLKRVLEVGDMTPETVNSMLFSGVKSDVQRLYASLTPKGRSNAQSAIINRAIEKAGGMENISPAKFSSEMKKLSDQVGIFFNAEQKARAEGLVKVLDATRRADEASVITPTGLQNYTTIGALGLGTMAGYNAAPIAASIGLMARVIESPVIRNLLVKIGKGVGNSRVEQEMIRRAATEIGKATNKF